MKNLLKLTSKHIKEISWKRKKKTFLKHSACKLTQVNRMSGKQRMLRTNN